MYDSYVYTFAYPDCTVFYVGIGRVNERVAKDGPNSNDRIRGHLRIAAKTYTNPPALLYEIIQYVWMTGGKVVIRKLYNHISHFEALEREYELIHQYGFDQLVNKPYLSGDQKRQRNAHYAAIPSIIDLLREEQVSNGKI